jgi:hypothetical protein
VRHKEGGWTWKLPQKTAEARRSLIYMLYMVHMLHAAPEWGVGWMLDAGCWMLDAGCWMLDARRHEDRRGRWLWSIKHQAKSASTLGQRGSQLEIIRRAGDFMESMRPCDSGAEVLRQAVVQEHSTAPKMWPSGKLDG